MILEFIVLQMCMCSTLFGLQTWNFSCSFLKVPTTFLRTAKALARLRLCAGSPEPLLVAYVISTFVSIMTRKGKNKQHPDTPDYGHFISSFTILKIIYIALSASVSPDFV